MYKPFPFHGPPKFTLIGNFGVENMPSGNLGRPTLNSRHTVASFADPIESNLFFVSCRHPFHGMLVSHQKAIRDPILRSRVEKFYMASSLCSGFLKTLLSSEYFIKHHRLLVGSMFFILNT
jgi:hypothetical protein